MGLSPLARIVLFGIGMGIAAIESSGFTEDPTWISAVATFLFILPAIFGGGGR